MPGKLPGQVTTLLQDRPYPLDLSQWESCLAGHPDHAYRDYLVSGIRDGFRIGYDYSRVSTIRSSWRNILSVREKADVVHDYLEHECAEHWVVCPSDPAQFPFDHITCLGVIPTSTAGKWRLIVDMSDSEGASINDGICEFVCSLIYVTDSDAVQSIIQVGQGALLVKVDIKSAYRNVPIHPEDRWLMGMSWEGALYIDTTLPFGLHAVFSPGILRHVGPTCLQSWPSIA